MNNLEKPFENIDYSLEHKIVRVVNDDNLDELFFNHGKSIVYELAMVLVNLYKKEFNETLKISTKSLAVEIYDHYKIMKWSKRFEKKHRSIRLTRWLICHMDSIDCGEMSVDNNRFLWDFLSIFSML